MENANVRKISLMTNTRDKANQPRVTVITPSLNQGRYLKECIASVIAQGYPNLEYFVIDGGSNDETLSVIRENEQFIDYWVSEPDRGQSDAINKGLRRATGELVCWLNADDYFLPSAIDRITEAYRENLFAPFYFGDGLRVDETGKELGNFIPPGQHIFDRRALLLGLNYILQPATFINRAALEAVGYLDVELQFGMDSDLWMRLSALGEPLPIRAVVAVTREYSSTKTASGSFRRIEELRQISMRHTGLPITPGVLCYFLDTLYKVAKESDAVFPPEYLGEIVTFWAKSSHLFERFNATANGFPRSLEQSGAPVAP